MNPKFNNLLALLEARKTFFSNIHDFVIDEIMEQTLKDIDTIIAQRCYEICSEFKKNNYVEQATGSEGGKNE